MKLRREQNYLDDIRPWSIFGPILGGMIIALIAVTTFCALKVDSGQSDAVISYNECVRIINEQWSEDDRAIIQKLEEDRAKLDGYSVSGWQEDGTLTAREMPMTKDEALHWMKLALLALLILFPLCVFLRYFYCKNRKFYLADFPLGTIYGRLLLILCLPIGWPFIVRSLCRMRRCHVTCDWHSIYEGELDQEACNVPLSQLDFVEGKWVMKQFIQSDTNTYDSEQAFMSAAIALPKYHNTKYHLPNNQLLTTNQKVYTSLLAMPEVQSIKVYNRHARPCVSILANVQLTFGDTIYDGGDFLLHFYFNATDVQCVRSGLLKKLPVATAFRYFTRYAGFTLQTTDEALVRQSIDHYEFHEAVKHVLQILETTDVAEQNLIPQYFAQRTTTNLTSMEEV